MISGLSEREIEGLIFAHCKPWRFSNSELVVDWTHRQLRLPSGVLDLMGITEWKNVVVAELKKGKADGRAIAQVGRYAFDIEKVFPSYEFNDGPKVLKCVIAEKFDDKTIAECHSMGVTPVLFRHDDLSLGVASDRLEYLMKTCRSVSDIRDGIMLKFEHSWSEYRLESLTQERIWEECMGASVDDLPNGFDRDGCEWFEAPVWEIMDDEPESSLRRKPLVDTMCRMVEL